MYYIPHLRSLLLFNINDWHLQFLPTEICYNHCLLKGHTTIGHLIDHYWGNLYCEGCKNTKSGLVLMTQRKNFQLFNKYFLLIYFLHPNPHSPSLLSSSPPTPPPSHLLSKFISLLLLLLLLSSSLLWQNQLKEERFCFGLQFHLSKSIVLGTTW